MSLLVHRIHPHVYRRALRAVTSEAAGAAGAGRGEWQEGGDSWLTISPGFDGGGGVARRSCLQSLFLWPIHSQRSAPKVANVVLKAKSSQILLRVKSYWSPWIEPELWGGLSKGWGLCLLIANGMASRFSELGVPLSPRAYSENTLSVCLHALQSRSCYTHSQTQWVLP